MAPSDPTFAEARISPLLRAVNALVEARLAGAPSHELRALAGAVGQEWAIDRKGPLSPEHAACLVGQDLAEEASLSARGVV